MIETEVKIKVNESEFNKLHRKIGMPDFVLQRNWGFFTGDGYVRIREEGDKKYITLKKRIEGSVISRDELEFEVFDVNLARNLFSCLGFFDEYYYEKRRASYGVNGCVVCLDYVKDLGYFVEVEGEEDKIRQCLIGFGLGDKKFERRSYFEMVRGETVLIDTFFG